MPETPFNAAAILEAVLKRAKAAGADAADALVGLGASLSLGDRLGKREKLERAESRDLGLRIFIGKRQAIVSSSDFSPTALDELAERAIAMARAVPEDSHCGLAEPDELARTFPDLDIFDSVEPSEAKLGEMVRTAEAAARAVKGVTNSEGAEAGWGSAEMALATSTGFFGAYRSSHVGLSVSVLAGDGTSMERDYDFSSSIYLSDLADPAQLGRQAGERAVRRLNPRKPKTAMVPVFFDPRIANSLIGHFLGAINGAGIARGTSFLKDRMGETVFAKGIDIIDDPLRRRGLRSRPFDGEGLPATRRHLVADGRLTTWLLDCRSARQLGLKSTGHAQRGTSSPPSPGASNVHLAKGRLSPGELMRDVAEGIYVTELIGSGVNGVTGDYSRGAAGFWIENGVLTHPVSEVTIAGNLKDMFHNLIPADDLEFKYGVNTPTLRIDGMTLAGA